MQGITYLGQKYSNEKFKRSFRMSSQVSECQGENEKNDLYYMYNFISIGLKKEIQRVKLDGRRDGLQKYILRPMMTWRHPGITWHIILMIF